MSVFVDSSALYAVLDADDDQHARAVSQWRHLLHEAPRLVTTNYILVETAALVQHRLGIDAVHALQHDIRPVLHVDWVDEALHTTGMSAMLTAGRRHLSLVDCVSFEAMTRAGLHDVFAFDQHFTERGFNCVPAKEVA